MRHLLILLTLLALFGAALSAAAPAWAHASLLDSQPLDGAVLTSAPRTLALTFNEPVSPTEMQLIGPGGATTPLGPATLSGDTVSMSVGAALGQGSYGLSWRVISADGHPVGGTVVFSVGKASASGTPVQAEQIDWPVGIGIWISRVLTYLGLFVGVGGACFAACIGRIRAGRWVVIALGAGLVALLPDLVFQGLDALDRPIGDAFAGAVWVEGAQASFGGFLAVAALALLLALAGSAATGRLGRLLSLLGLLAVGVAFATTGHASTADPQWLTRPAVFLHTLCVTFWIGALLPLAGLLRLEPPAAVPALQRFAAIIPGVVTVLLVTGITLATIQVGAPAELLMTGYGTVFLTKMALVACLLGLAAYNRWRLTEPARSGAHAARRRLVGVMAAELILAGVVLGVVALWRFTPPPRALLEAAEMPVTASFMGSDGMAEITVTPGRGGPVALDIRIFDAAMQPLAAQQVTIDLGNAAQGIQPIEKQAVRGPDGDWHVEGLDLPVGGTWQVELDVLVSTFRMVMLDGTVTLRR